MTISPAKLPGLAVSALAVTALALAGCASHSTNSATTSSAAGSGTPGGVTTVTVGITGATAPPTFLPLIAQKFGLDTKNHVAIKFVTLSPSVTAQSLSKGSVNILAAPSVEEATLQGASFKIIAGAALSYWHFVAKEDVASWSDLAGKKVGLPCGVGATCVAFADDVLKAHDVNPTSVTFINGTAQGTYEALAAGSVDAALTTAPYTYALSGSGKTHEFDITDQAPYLSTQFTASSSYVNANGTVVNEFVTAMNEAATELTTLPVSAKVLSVIDAFEQANGIDPTTLNQKEFLTQFAQDKSWQLVPTKALITRDLQLIGQADPTASAAAKSATFSQLVYQVPEFAGRYA
ncbi:MAG TPA: ABC transporter substrate-binding protein [Trebonia sp.]|nr:ABC transporter substrate-binding protein [Trebonia sp.]